ncbi:MAG: signal peptidase I [Oleiphilaceae bacterium]|nr:signal peptidase I [Oleiphilaceae bacterium]
MDIDFPLVLVISTFVTGLIWLADVVLWKPKRLAAMSAQRSEEDVPAEPWLVETSRSFFPVLAIVLVLRSFLIEPFQIPSGSMLPTLEVGDFILVNKFSYGLRLPVAGTKFVEIDDPQRGDIMVFKYPEDGKTNYIKRVVGVPGDTIEYRDKVLKINGEEVPERFLAHLPPHKLFEEQLGSITHRIYEHQKIANKGAEGVWTVPENAYFVMGDNRDNSKDSRFWGFVPDELVVGKAFAIWMQWKSLTSLPSFSRVGGIE